MLYIFGVQEINGSHITKLFRKPVIKQTEEEQIAYRDQLDNDPKHTFCCLYFETDKHLSINEYRKKRNRSIDRTKVKNLCYPGLLYYYL